MKRWMMMVAAAGATLVGSHTAFATTVPFTEDFDLGVAGWEDSVNNPLTFLGAGGPDGGSYASAAFNYLGFVDPFGGGGPVIFRAHDSDNASGDAFVGDWLLAGVIEVSAWVRHNTSENLSFFLRVASSFNFPGAVFGNANPVLVAPNTWTQVTWQIDPSDPLCSGETVTCAQALMNVGNFQIGTDAPVSLVATDFAFTLDIDKVSLTAVPEPGTSALLSSALAGLAVVGRRRTRS